MHSTFASKAKLIDFDTTTIVCTFFPIRLLFKALRNLLHTEIWDQSLYVGRIYCVNFSTKLLINAAGHFSITLPETRGADDEKHNFQVIFLFLSLVSVFQLFDLIACSSICVRLVFKRRARKVLAKIHVSSRLPASFLHEFAGGNRNKISGRKARNCHRRLQRYHLRLKAGP